MAMLDSMNYDGQRTYCTTGNPDAWVLVDGEARLPLEGWQLPELIAYILPHIPEDKAFFWKGYLCVNLTEE